MSSLTGSVSLTAIRTPWSLRPLTQTTTSLRLIFGFQLEVASSRGWGAKIKEKIANILTASTFDHHMISLNCIDRGLAEEGELPGGLRVRRRAGHLFQRLQKAPHSNLRLTNAPFDHIS